MQLSKICDRAPWQNRTRQRSKETKAMTTNYEDRLLRVLRYIHDNPDGDLSLDRLADEAALSRFHWHRVFRAMTGETCTQAVRRMRMYRAASQLVKTTQDIDRIARTCGYPNMRSFGRAFADVFDLTPVAYRNRGQVPNLAPAAHRPEPAMYDIEILSQPARDLVALPHQGAYDTVGRSFDQLSALFGARGLWPQARGMVAVSCDGPDQVPEAELRSYACIQVENVTTVDDPLEMLHLPAGRYAVLHHHGPYAGLKAAYDQIYGVWLPQSGEEPGDSWPYERFLNTPMDTAPDDLRTDICVPLK